MNADNEMNSGPDEEDRTIFQTKEDKSKLAREILGEKWADDSDVEPSPSKL